MKNQKELSDSFEGLIDALKKCDVNELEKKILDEYKGFTLHGTIETKSDILKHFTPDGVSLTDYIVENPEYEILNKIGIITGKGIIAGNYKEIEFRHEVLFTDIFKYIDKQWKYYKSQVTEIKSA